MKKEIIDSILSPTEIIRPAPYTQKKEYRHLQEEPREIYLSSAFYKSHWMWSLVKDSIVGAYTKNEKERKICFCTDYELTIHHGIRSKAQLRRERSKMDSLTFDMEYNNIMIGGSSSQYYSYELVSASQVLKKAFYPKTLEEYFDSKRKRLGDIKKQKGEIRILSMDIAMSESTDKTKNDFSVIKCIRALPMNNKYERQEVYTEAFEGVDIDTQAIRVRQIADDFDMDYFVFDARTYGTNLVDSMAKILYDEERDKEYEPWKVMNNDVLARRCKNTNAIPCMWAFIGSADNNHALHTQMLGALKDGKYKMLISHMKCKEEYLMDKKEYELGTFDDKARYEHTYIYSDLTLNEMINLNKEFIQGGKIKLVEPSTGTKDKYITSGMGNLFIQEELETQLTARDEYNNDGVFVLW